MNGTSKNSLNAVVKSLVVEILQHEWFRTPSAPLHPTAGEGLQTGSASGDTLSPQKTPKRQGVWGAAVG